MSEARGGAWLRGLGYVAIAVVLVLMVLASSRRGTNLLLPITSWVPGGDKGGHFLMMGLLTCGAIVAFRSARIGGRRLGALGCVVAVSVFVTLEELSQAAVPWRSFSLLDLAASYAGIAVFAVPVLAWRQRRREPAPRS